MFMTSLRATVIFLAEFFIMNKILEARNLVKKYGEQKVINGISFEVEEGEFVSLIGESGSGKSTLLYLLSGIEKPDEGKIFIDGREITALSERELAKMRAETFAFVFQFDNLLSNLTIWENLLMPSILSKRLNAETERQATELMEYLNISEIKDKRPAEVSGGEQQRASIARALIINPKIVFLDEPTGSLDSENNKQIMDLLVRLNEEKGTTLVQVTHSMQNAQRTKRIVKMRDGVLIDA